ncbi:metallophosphoesterase [Maioricimonas sp. JC845]|uniref:metallophosphoesterase n=1 Tax=Maioricimonas sp. JC845 TaxID=3232138 RepID=UPI00345AECA2
MECPTSINGPVAVIGDVHGQVEKLLAVLDRLRALPDYDRRWIVFIGDLVDRGPDPKGAIDVALDLMLEHSRTTIVSGNHEFAMAASAGLLPVPEYSNWSARWVDHYGADTTFESYGAEFGNLDDLVARMPERHRELLSDLPWCVEHPEYLFVHAGLDPNQPLAMQLPVLRKRDYSLTRPPWLCSKSFADAEIPGDCHATVVSGHVPVESVYFGPKRILTDTTGGIGGDLSCVLLPEGRVITSGQDRSDRRQTAAAPATPRQQTGNTKGGGWLKFWK